MAEPQTPEPEPAPSTFASRIAYMRRAGVAALFVMAILIGALIGVLLALENDLPQISSLENFQPNIITQVFAQDEKTPIGEFAIEKRVIVSFRDIPPVLRNAIVAVEDADFWKHLGINPWTIPGAVLQNLRSGHKSRGFSTITMQLSRNLFLTPDKTMERKIKEIILAFQIEKNFTKEEIFTLYCNQMYLGHGNYGVEAASQFYFGKSIRDLDIAEAAVIAGMFQSPGRVTPIDTPDRALARRNHVINRMLDEKYISKMEADRALKQPLGLHLHRGGRSIAPYFVEEIRKYLEHEYGSQRIYQGGLHVYTTLDPRMQIAANHAVRSGLRALDRRARGFVPPTESVLTKDGHFPATVALEDWQDPIVPGRVVKGVVRASDRALAVVQIGEYEAEITLADIASTRKKSVAEVLPRGIVAPFLVESVSEAGQPRRLKVTLEQEPKVEGALLAMDVRTGAIRAMVGGYDFERSKFNRATQAYRQVGSAFKPIVYAAALEKLGYNAMTPLLDTPISFPDPWTHTIWAPHNYDNKFMGSVPLHFALAESRNIPAVRTLQAVGVKTGIEYARKLGLSGELPPFLPIALGAGEATVVELTAAYSAFANQGLRMKPMMITRITDRDNNVIEESHPQATDAIRADTAYLMTHLLRGVVDNPHGTAAKAKSLKRPIGGKTGTVNEFSDAWFIGFEPQMVCGVWVGFDEKKELLGKGETGAKAALPIWMEFWEEAMKDAPIEEYRIPANVVFVPVDETGRPSRPGLPGVTMVPFIAGTEPRAAITVASQAAPENGSEATAKLGTP